MKLLNTFILCLFALSGFAQTDLVDSVVYKDRCECLEDIYQIKKDFLDNVSFVEEKAQLNPSFIEKHQINWGEFIALDARCADLTQNTEDSPCFYAEKLREISDDIELIIRVIEMNSLNVCRDG